MTIEQMQVIISAIADGFERSVAECLEVNRGAVVDVVQEQLWSGVDGTGKHLSPNYDNDPFFNEPGYWYKRNADYKEWKRQITPPSSMTILALPPRPDNIPNLFIDGTFYSGIEARMTGKELEVYSSKGNGPAIADKCGNAIFDMGERGIGYFNATFLMPWIEDYFAKCGYTSS